MKHRKISLPLSVWQRIGVRSSFSLVLGLIATIGYLELSASFYLVDDSNNSGTQYPLVRFGPRDLVPEVTTNTGDIKVDSGQIADEVMTTDSIASLHHTIRQTIVKQMMSHGFSGWQTHPWMGDTNGVMYSRGTGEYVVRYPIDAQDELDYYLDDLLDLYRTIPLDPTLRKSVKTKDIVISEEDWREWSDINLFKTTQDLLDLDYEIVSHRTRANIDKEYRRYNIKTAFAKLGNVIVLNPGQTISYMRDIDFDDGPRINYQYGLSIIGDEELMDYGGGICGSSTALYQGILTNTALDITKQRSHSRRYSDLYPAIINGQSITTPGIDSALYLPMLDLIFTNTRNYPVILVANYDGTLGGVEEVFSLAKPQDRGSFEFVSSRKTTTVDTKGKTLNGGCYTWLINSKQQTSCYKKVE